MLYFNDVLWQSVFRGLLCSVWLWYFLIILTCFFHGFQHSRTQPGLFTYSVQLECWIFAWSRFTSSNNNPHHLWKIASRGTFVRPSVNYWRNFWVRPCKPIILSRARNIKVKVLVRERKLATKCRRYASNFCKILAILNSRGISFNCSMSQTQQRYEGFI